ncbi:MAG: hypothetical protein ACXW61_02740 [Gemmatirosa sp.]
MSHPSSTAPTGPAYTPASPVAPDVSAGEAARAPVRPTPDRAERAIAQRDDAFVTAAILATAAVGVAVAIAPLIPALVRMPVLALALLGWTLAVAAGAARILAFAAAALRTHATRAPTIVAVTGALVVLVSAAQTMLVRWLHGRPGFTWIIDWRWAVSHARGIARYGGVDRALDYAGAGMSYHVGPAWLAGAAEQASAGSVELVLLGLVPVTCAVAMLLAGTRLLRRLGLAAPWAAVVVVTALTLPAPDANPFQALALLRGLLTAPSAWPFLAADLMLNSILALAVGLSACALLLDDAATVARRALGALALAALVALKPQFFVGFGLVVGLVALRRVLARDPRLLATALGALALGVAAVAVLPGDPRAMEAPRWRPDDLRALTLAIALPVVLLAVVALVPWQRRGDGHTTVPRRAHELLTGALVALLALIATFHVLDFPLHDEIVARAQALGLVDYAGTGAYAANAEESNLRQSLEPVLLLTMLGALGVAAARLGAGGRAAACVLALLVVLTPVHLLVRGFVAPMTLNAAADARELAAALAQIPVGGELVIANDLADPADDYRRALRAPLLTAIAGHQFHVANLRYVHHVREDAPARLQALRTFFGAPWSPWHAWWLARTGVTHVLVHERCPPPWLDAADTTRTPLPAITRGAWTVLAVPTTTDANAGAASPAAPAFTDVPPRFGRAACLTEQARPAAP